MTGDAAVIENLELLRHEWGNAYVIWFQTGLYRACRRDDAAICRRLKANDLREELDTDYEACPVMARGLSGGAEFLEQ